MNWFYADNGQQRGPVDEVQIRQLLAGGSINQQTLVWREGMPQWAPLSQTELGSGGMPPLPPHEPVPPTAYAQPQMPSYAGPQVPNYLVQAILVTICCCVPFGVVAIVYAAQVNPKLAANDFAGARSASDNARLWCWVAFIVGLITVGAGSLLVVAGSVHG